MKSMKQIKANLKNPNGEVEKIVDAVLKRTELEKEEKYTISVKQTLRKKLDSPNLASKTYKEAENEIVIQGIDEEHESKIAKGDVFFSPCEIVTKTWIANKSLDKEIGDRRHTAILQYIILKRLEQYEEKLPYQIIIL